LGCPAASRAEVSIFRILRKYGITLNRGLILVQSRNGTKEEPDYQRRQTNELQEAIEARHSVRAYKNEHLAEDVVKALEEQITVLNQ
jgi:hypothetical protein